MALAAEEMARIDGNPVFELYDFGYTDDLRRLIQIENFVTVNNALQVDLTGQVSAESIGHQMYTGVGGQTVFMIAGAYSPRRQVGERHAVELGADARPVSGSRASCRRSIRAASVTVPRTYVDYVVTEHGIATLRGKTIKERVRALLEITHPDFRDELTAEATRLYAI